MRPLGEVSLALLAAAKELFTPERAPTLSELAGKAGVARGAARVAVASLKQRGRLCIVRERKADHRNRPVAEYALPEMAPAETVDGINELQRACSLWVQR